MSLGEMCEGVKDTGQVKEVGSAGIKPQSDPGEGGTLELDDIRMVPFSCEGFSLLCRIPFSPWHGLS